MKCFLAVFVELVGLILEVLGYLTCYAEAAILYKSSEIKNFIFRIPVSLLPFVGICLFIISEWVPLSDGLLQFL